MCTSIVSNKGKTFVGWNLDLLDMPHRVVCGADGVYIEVWDATEGWMPIFGANRRGDFVGMPTCWPYDSHSDPEEGVVDVIHLDVDLLMMRRTFRETYDYVSTHPICSVPGLTFMGALSDSEGNVLHIVPGQGYRYYARPTFAVLTNFSPFKMDAERHPWMGWDRYTKAVAMLEKADDSFGVDECFAVLRAVSQEVCPTVVSMVFDVVARRVYWCEDRQWDAVHSWAFQCTMG